MSLSQQALVSSYTANGSTTVFPFSFKIFTSNQVVVAIDGVIQSNGFNIEFDEIVTGGSVVFIDAPMSGSSIRISRKTSIVRTTDFVKASALDSDILDSDLDYLTAIAQESDGYGLKLDSTGNWDATNTRIVNVADPINSNDSANKLYVEQTVTRLGNLPVPISGTDNGKILRADAGAATWQTVTSAIGYTPVNKAGDTITGTLSVTGSVSLNSSTNTINNAQFTNSPTGPTPVLNDNSTKLSTTKFVQDTVWAGNQIRIIDSDRKSGNAFGIIRNNQIFVSGQFSQYIGQNSVVNKFGFVHVPFQNPQQIPAGTTIVDAAIAGWSIFVWLSNGWCYSCGVNGYGHLGHGNTTAYYTLKRIEYFVTNNIFIDKVYAPAHIYCDDETAYLSIFFRSTNGNLYGAGYNDNGELGIGNITSPISTPTQVLAITNVTMLSVGGAGGGHCIAVSSNNPKQVWTWGYNSTGQLGNGNTILQHTPAVRYTHTSDITKIKSAKDFYYTTSWSGFGSSVFLAGGEIWATGYNAYGQLGIGNNTSATSFTKATGSQVWVDFDVTGGNTSSIMAIDSNGAVWGTGYGGYGHMGNGSANTNIFTISNITSGAVSLKTSVYSTYGITVVKKSDGYLYSAGYNGNGGLARGNAAFAATNITFEVMTGPIGYQVVDYQIILSLYYRYENVVFMLTADGSLLATGGNLYGIMSNRDTAIGYSQDCFNYCELTK